MQKFSEKITLLMEIKGYTQSTLGEILNMSQAAVGKWQRGESTPNPRTMMKLAEFFQVPYENLRDNSIHISSDNFTKSVILGDEERIKEHLNKIIALRNELNSTIAEIEILLKKQIASVKKF